MRKSCSILMTIAVPCSLVSLAMAGADQAAWLGCRIAPVPKSLDAHLDLAAKGTMVINVAKDSPADKAGLERYDVITKLGEESVTSPDRLITLVSKHKPGDKVALQVIHKGTDKRLEITLAVRPKVGEEQYKYDRLPDALLDDRIGVHGRILRRGPDGWIIEDLGELDGVPEPFDRLLPKRHRREGRIWLDKEGEPVKKFQARVTQDGRVIVVEGDTDGEITVRRIDEKGAAEVVRTYESARALKEADPEAYKIYLQATGRDREGKDRARPHGERRYRTIRPKDPAQRYQQWFHDFFDRMPAYDDLINEKRLEELYDLYGKKGKQWREQLEKRLDATSKRLQELQERIEKRLEELRKSDETAEAVEESSESSPKAATRFEVSSDGQITVHVRKDDAELTLTFKDADELKAKRPDLFEKYQPLVSKP